MYTNKIFHDRYLNNIVVPKMHDFLNFWDKDLEIYEFMLIRRVLIVISSVPIHDTGVGPSYTFYRSRTCIYMIQGLDLLIHSTGVGLA